MVALPGFNPLRGGATAYKVQTGAYYFPEWAYRNSGQTLTTTISRLYYIPFFIKEIRSYAGAAMWNSGAGDNGETLRLGIYDDNAAAGGPGTLLKDFGEITLTGASAERLLSSAWTPTSTGPKWFAYHANTAAAVFSMSNILQVTAAGYIIPSLPIENDMGTIAPAVGSTANVVCQYVDTTYGALASTAVAATATTTSCPVIALKA